MQVDTLRAALGGTLIARDEASYDRARKDLIFNGSKPEIYPAMIVRATDVADVQTTLRFASAEGVTVSVRGSGHHWSGIALQDGIVLDISALDAVSVDRSARIAKVGPGVSNRALARILSENGCAFPLGHCGTVMMSGYLLGGGFGWNSGTWGMASLGIESVDVVTADGIPRRASETENPDIFWAARGGGPAFFGVVTSYRLRLRPLPRAIMTSVWTYPLERIAEVEGWMSRTMNSGVANLEFTAAMTSAPSTLAGAGKVVSGIATIFADSETEANDMLGRTAASAPPGALDVQQGMPTPFDTLYDIIGRFFPDDARYAADSFWSDRPAGLFHGLASGVAASASPSSFAIGVVLPPSGPLAPDAALSISGRAFGAAYAIWTDASEDERQRAWLRSTADALTPEILGHYVGEADLDRAGCLAGCFSPAAWARLLALRQWHDPAGLFAHATVRSSRVG